MSGQIDSSVISDAFLFRQGQREFDMVAVPEHTDVRDDREIVRFNFVRTRRPCASIFQSATSVYTSTNP